MVESSPCRKKKKLTLAASEKGVETAEKALLRLGFESKSNFAESQRLSRSTVTKFFNHDPIQPDSFKRICDALKLNWQEIAGITQDSIDCEPITRVVNPSLDTEEGVTQTMLVRQVIILEKTSQTTKSVITLKGDLDSIANIQVIAAILKEYRGDTIQITDIQEGSIKLIVEGSQEDIDRLLNKIRSGELTEIDGFPVEDVQILKESSEDDENSKQKWCLIEEIVTNKMGKRDLSGADLSDTGLRNAYLIGANLNEADLSDADLSGAYLSDADLSGAYLSDADLSGAYLTSANLSGASLTSANLSRVYLIVANLSGANLSGANLSGADLSGADLSGADLSGADLSDADLSVANLSGANLSGANLSGANLSAIQVEQTRFSHNLGITQQLKQDLINREAIFEDSPGDRSHIFTRV
jgi:uncharacterized protein YjbI with pentapeptide repeats